MFPAFSFYFPLFFTAVDCGGLVSPANGVVSTPAGTTFPAEATYSCNEGYVLSSDATRKCEASKKWSGTSPSCNSSYKYYVMLHLWGTNGYRKV